jgi:predicted transcriptional regulator
MLLSQRHKRSRFDVCLRVLELLGNQSMTLGEIAVYARLNFRTSKRLLDDLVSRQFLSKEERDDETVYRLTPIGRILLIDLRSIYQRLG